MSIDNKYLEYKVLGCYPHPFRLGNSDNPVLIVIFYIDSLFLKIQGLPITNHNKLCTRSEKICKLFFLHYKHIHQVHTSCLYVYVLLIFLLSLKCLWKVTSCMGLLLLGSLIKMAIFTLLEACAGDSFNYNIMWTLHGN